MDDTYISSMPEGEPEPEAPPPVPAYKLFDSGSVTLATFFGTPFSGSILMAINYRRIGKETNAAFVVLGGLAVTIAAIIGGNLLPGAVTSGLGIGLILGMRSFAQVLQGPAVREHVSQGGSLASRWAAFGVGAGMLFGIFSVLFVALLAQQLATMSGSKGTPAVDTKITVGTKDEVHYAGSATKEDAQALGDLLKRTGFFTDKGALVQLSKGQAGTVVSFAVKDGYWDRPEIVSAFEGVGHAIGPTVGGFPLQLRLMNTSREVKREMTVGKVTLGSNDDVYYFGTATEADATSLAQALKSAGYFTDKGATVLLSKEGSTTLSFVVREGFWDRTEYVVVLQKLTRMVAPSVGGLPIKLRMVNQALDPQREVTVQ